MMRENPKHELRNRQKVESFKRHYSGFPKGVIRTGMPKKEPDIVVNTQVGDVGIEITEFYREKGQTTTALQAQESLKEGIVERSQKIYEKDGNSPIIVSIFWSAHIKLNKKDVCSISDKLKSLIADNIPEIEGYVKLDDAFSLPDGIAAINIYRIKELNESDWLNWYYDFIPDYTPERIQQIINEKNTKVSNYRDGFRSLWLLIVAVGTRPSSLSKLSRDVLEATYNSYFNKVFFFEMFTGEVEELNIQLHQIKPKSQR